MIIRGYFASLGDPRTFHAERDTVDIMDRPLWAIVNDAGEHVEPGLGYTEKKGALDRIEEMIEQFDVAEIEAEKDELILASMEGSHDDDN